MPIDVVQHFKGLTSNEDRAVTAVAAIQTLTTVLQESTALIMSLVQDIRSAAEELAAKSKNRRFSSKWVAPYFRYVTRMFAMVISMLARRRLLSVANAAECRTRADSNPSWGTPYGWKHDIDTWTIQVRGELLSAAKTKTFNVLISEGRGRRLTVVGTKLLKF